MKYMLWPDGEYCLYYEFRLSEWGHKSDDYEIVDVTRFLHGEPIFDKQIGIDNLAEAVRRCGIAANVAVDAIRQFTRALAETRLSRARRTVHWFMYGTKDEKFLK